MLVQQPDLGEIRDGELRHSNEASANDGRDAHDAFRVESWRKHVKSNAIVFAKDGATLGVGAGQMSRVDSVENRG